MRRAWAIGLVLLAGCAAAPLETVRVTWEAGTCGTRTKVITFFDSRAPALDCLAAYAEQAKRGVPGAGNAAAMVGGLLLVGAPVGGCTVYWNADRAAIYAALSPGFAQAAASVFTLKDGEAVLEHELRHALFPEHAHNLLNVWDEDCGRK